MVCFKCRTYAYSKKVRGVPIQECPQCKGIWCDNENLEKLSAKYPSINLSSARIRSGKTGYQCSRCSGDVREIEFSHKDQVVAVDECQTCHGLWFDRGELTKIRSFSRDVELTFDEQRIRKFQKKTVRKEKLSGLYGTETPVSKESTSIRNQFIAKVYQLFTLSLLCAGVGASVGVILGMTYVHYWKLVILELLVLILAWAVRRNKQWNRIALFSFTTLSGFTTSPFLNILFRSGNGRLVLIAFIITLLLFVGLSSYVNKTRKDFSSWGASLSAFLWILIVSAIFGLIFPNLLNWFIFAGLSLLLFCGFVIYDTSRIILKYATDEYIAATLDLYLDFLNIFVDMLRMMFESSR